MENVKLEYDPGYVFLDVFSYNIDQTTKSKKCIFQRTLNYQSWSVSKDEKHVMIVHDSISVFRYSSLAKYTVVSLEQR